MLKTMGARPAALEAAARMRVHAPPTFGGPLESRDYKDVLDGIMRDIERLIEDEAAYAAEQARNDAEDAIQYAHDVGFDEGWQTARDEMRQG